MIDPLLGSWLERMLPATALSALQPELEQIASAAGGEPEALRLAIRPGSVPTDCERQRGRHARIEQFARVYVLHRTSNVDSASLASTGRWPVNDTPGTASMLAMTRTWGSIRDVALMRRGLAAARSQAALPLHFDALAALEAEAWGAFLMSFLVVDLQGRLDGGEIDGQQRALLRLATPLTRLMTGKQAVTVLTELIDGFGAADPALSRLLQDAQVRPAWEGATNALALDALQRADLHDALAALLGRASCCLRSINEPRLAAAGRQAVGALERAALWLESGKEPEVLEAGARRLALTLARGLQLALLCEHAQWMLDHGGDRRGFAAALRYSRLPVDLVHEVDPELDRQLLA